MIVPYAAGCQTLGIYPYREAEAEPQRAVLGLTDLSARAAVCRQLGDGFLTFTVPLHMFDELEKNVDGSFLERPTWQSLVSRK